MTYYLLEATLNGRFRIFFFFFFLHLIYYRCLMARQFYITTGLTVKLNDKETVNKSWF